MLYYIMNTYLNTYIIDGLYITCVLSGILVISNNNAIVSIIYLIILYLTVSLYLYYIGLGIIGLLYILIYVGAITILFLFILSLMDIHMSELTLQSTKSDYILILISIVLLISIYLYISEESITSTYNNIISNINNIFNTSNNIIPLNDYNIYTVLSSNTNDIVNNTIELRVISTLLYTEYAFVFLLLGIILLFSIVTAISLLHTSSIKEL